MTEKVAKKGTGGGGGGGRGWEEWNGEFWFYQLL